MTHSKASASPFLGTPSASTASRRAVSARPLDRRRGARAFATFALSLLSAIVGASAVSYAGDGELVAAITKTGFGGHPYSWAAPSC